MNTLDDVKAYMASQNGPRTVSFWNYLREELKKAKIKNTLLHQLDASGYITEWLKQTPA